LQVQSLMSTAHKKEITIWFKCSLTNTTQHSPSRVANSSSASQEMPYISWNTNRQNIPPMAPILSQMYPLYTLWS